MYPESNDDTLFIMCHNIGHCMDNPIQFIRFKFLEHAIKNNLHIKGLLLLIKSQTMV